MEALGMVICDRYNAIRVPELLPYQGFVQPLVRQALPNVW